ncbi:SdrD B-like domain-containing protein, partial [Jiangella gansuensis]|uniref:SdrD B-like domain-containing protein n=1 Tax=Jiangella gansuensis TaxID=281473 RepID=UPI00056407AD
MAGAITALGVIGSTLAGAGATLPALAAPGDPITGTIWQDYDSDGILDTFEDNGRLEGIEVYAYDADGNVAGPVTTGPDGTYSLPVTSDAGPWRVEANVPDTPEWAAWRDSVVGRAAGTSNGTTVQFIDSMPAAEVDFSFQVPSAYVENNPLVYVPDQRFGPSDGVSAAEPGGVTIEYEAESNAVDDPVPQTAVVPFSQVGSTNGSAIFRAEAPDEIPTVLTAAYLKRNSGFGPEGIGAIYRVTPDGDDWLAPTASAELYVDVTDYGIDLGGPDPNAGQTAYGLRPDVTADNPNYDWARDAQAWNNVGRGGLGTIAFSADQQYLYAVNLHNRSLIQIETGGDISQPPVSVREIELDGYFPDGSDLRPFGVSSDPLTDELYLAVTDTAETTQNAGQLHGYIYSFRPEVPENLTEVLNFPLDFPRNGYQTQFYPWATQASQYFTNGVTVFYPMPVVADAKILHGNLIIGVRDLTGDTMATNVPLSGDPTDGDTRFLGGLRSEGDVFIATPSGDGTFTLESNGIAGGVVGAGVAKGILGPGGLKYFDTHWSDIGGTGPVNSYEALGSIVVVPSRDDGVLTTGLHVANAGLQSGMRRLFQNTGQPYDPRGAMIKRTLVGTEPGINGKGNGLGSASVLASAAPIEIGNFVWYDVDNDGVQDPDEPVVEGATVNLYEVDADGNRTLVSTTTTDGKGEYYFSSNDAAYQLKTHTDYVVGVDNPADYGAGGPLENWYPTVPDTGDANSVDADRNDSDGIVESTDEGDFPYAAITTGGPGENDHTIDFGYSNIDYEFDKRMVSGPTENPDDDGTWTITYELVVENTGMIDGGYLLTDDLTGYGEGVEVVDTQVVSGPPEADGLLNPDWDGSGDMNVVTDVVPIEAQSTVENGTEHIYTLTVSVALETDPQTGEAIALPEDLACTPDQVAGEGTTGLFNTATLDPTNHEDLTDDECSELPLVTLDKTVVTEPYVVDRENQPGVWEITYGLTVTNETEVLTDYDLEDLLRFGTGIEIVDGSVVAENTVPGTIVTRPEYDGVSDVLIVE